MANTHQQQFLRRMSSLTFSEENSDLRISCLGFEFKAHRTMVVSASAKLRAMIGYADDGAPALLFLGNYDPYIVKCMLEYLYTADYAIPEPGQRLDDVPSQRNGNLQLPLGPRSDPTVPWTTEGALRAHFGVCSLGCHCEIQPLRALAAEKIQHLLDASGWPRVGFLAVLQEGYHLAGSRDEDLSNVLVNHCTRHCDDVLVDLQEPLSAAADVGSFICKVIAALRTSMMSTNQNMSALRDEVKALKETVEDAKEEAANAKKEVADAKKEFRNAEADSKRANKAAQDYFQVLNNIYYFSSYVRHCRECNERARFRYTYSKSISETKTWYAKCNHCENKIEMGTH